MRDRRSPLSVEALDALAWDKMGGMMPGVVQDAQSGRVLMLGYLNREALEATLTSGFATFWSRSKARLWMKGESSGNRLRVCAVHEDCDGDALLLLALPEGPTCHEGTASCFGEGRGRIAQKVGEEGLEVALAAVSQGPEAVSQEAADLLYHLAVLLHDQGLDWGDVIAVLKTRGLG